MVVDRPPPAFLSTTFSPRTTSTGMMPLFLTTPTMLTLPSEPANGGCAITFIELPAYTCCTVTMLPHDRQIASSTPMIDSYLILTRATFSASAPFLICGFILPYSSPNDTSYNLGVLHKALSTQVQNCT